MALSLGLQDKLVRSFCGDLKLKSTRGFISTWINMHWPVRKWQFRALIRAFTCLSGGQINRIIFAPVNVPIRFVTNFRCTVVLAFPGSLMIWLLSSLICLQPRSFV